MPMLNTSYLGFELPHPFIVGASPLCYEMDTVKALEDAGASAIVLHSLFEEQIVRENIHGFPSPESDTVGLFAEADEFPLNPDLYLEHIQRLKEATSFPVIASINGVHLGSWTEFARQMAQAGADAIELNLYFIPQHELDPSSEIESSAVQILRTVRNCTSLPLAVKLSPAFAGLPRFVMRLEEAGANAIVLFNNFFQPDINIEKLVYDIPPYSAVPSDLSLRTRWAATLYSRIESDIAISGGIHSPEDAIKAILAGANALQVVSGPLQHGPDFFKTLVQEVPKWMKAHQFTSLNQVRGLLSFARVSNTQSLNRAAYLQFLQQTAKQADS